MWWQFNTIWIWSRYILYYIWLLPGRLLPLFITYVFFFFFLNLNRVGTFYKKCCNMYSTCQNKNHFVLLSPKIPSVGELRVEFCWRLSQPQGHSVAGRIMSMKNSNDTIRNRTRDLPTCSAVPQPTLRAWTDPEGSRTLRLPGFKTFGTWRW
jgi:hypothetical protein